MCEVTEKVPGLETVKWENEEGQVFVSRPSKTTRGDKVIFTAAVDILYDDWSKGAKFICVVEHKDDIDRPKKIYTRENGKADILVPHFLI